MYCKKHLKDSTQKSLHLKQKYAWTFVLGYYQFFEAHTFSRAARSENCSLLAMNYVREQICEYFRAKWRLLILTLFIYVTHYLVSE